VQRSAVPLAHDTAEVHPHAPETGLKLSSPTRCSPDRRSEAPRRTQEGQRRTAHLLVIQDELRELPSPLPGGLLAPLSQRFEQPSGSCHESATPIFTDLGSALFTRARHRGFEPLTYGSGGRGDLRVLPEGTRVQGLECPAPVP
jgi:hypothetical protein